MARTTAFGVHDEAHPEGKPMKNGAPDLAEPVLKIRQLGRRDQPLPVEVRAVIPPTRLRGGRRSTAGAPTALSTGRRSTIHGAIVRTERRLAALARESDQGSR